MGLVSNNEQEFSSKKTQHACVILIFKYIAMFERWGVIATS